MILASQITSEKNKEKSKGPEDGDGLWHCFSLQSKTEDMEAAGLAMQ